MQHEAICEFPSKQFYNGELKADKSLAKRKSPGRRMKEFWPRDPNCPIVFCNVVGEEEENKTHGEIERGQVDSHSKYNRQEAEKVASPSSFRK